MISNGRPLTVTDPLNHTTALTYERGDLVSVTDPTGATATRFVDSAGRVRRVTDPLHARDRGWRHLRLLSSAGNTFNRDYFAENPDESQNPLLHVFVRRGATVHHAYTTELLFAPTEPGQHPRHIDATWPLWNLFDLTPEGRGQGWHPQLTYER